MGCDAIRVKDNIAGTRLVGLATVAFALVTQELIDFRLTGRKGLYGNVAIFGLIFIVYIFGSGILGGWTFKQCRGREISSYWVIAIGIACYMVACHASSIHDAVRASVPYFLVCALCCNV